MTIYMYNSCSVFKDMAVYQALFPSLEHPNLSKLRDISLSLCVCVCEKERGERE